MADIATRYGQTRFRQVQSQLLIAKNQVIAQKLVLSALEKGCKIAADRMEEAERSIQVINRISNHPLAAAFPTAHSASQSVVSHADLYPANIADIRCIAQSRLESAEVVGGK